MKTKRCIFVVFILCMVSCSLFLVYAATSPELQYGIGLIHETRQDYHQAKEWFEKAAAQGDAYAQFALGDMYADGVGVQQDRHQAKEWFGKACDNKSQRACDRYKALDHQDNP